MSYIDYHYRINKIAYKMLKKKIGKLYFPNEYQMFIFNTILSPDIVHSFKFIYGYHKFNHMNTGKKNNAYERVLKHYEKLVTKLKFNQGAFYAAWLAHFVVDCLEPMHLSDWKVKNPEERRKKMLLHIWIESKTRNIEIKKNNIVNIKGAVGDYIDKKADEIKSLNVDKYYPDTNKIKKIYENNITPIHVQAVASIWYKAVCL